MRPDLEVIKLFMLNSIEQEINPAHNAKMPITVSILTFISRINRIAMSFKAINCFSALKFV